MFLNETFENWDLFRRFVDSEETVIPKSLRSDLELIIEQS